VKPATRGEEEDINGNMELNFADSLKSALPDACFAILSNRFNSLHRSGDDSAFFQN
jgi:hypothetical protein